MIMIFPTLSDIVCFDDECPSIDNEIPAVPKEWADEDVNIPIGRANLMMAYDIESDITIIYGGWKTPEPYELGDTWSYDFNNDTYTNMTPSVSPPFLEVGGMEYDSQSDRMVMFGGLTDFNNYIVVNETWTYDYNTNTWENKTSGAAPSPRASIGFAYDSESDRMILFGGENGTTKFNDTWAYDLESNTWEKMNPAVVPGARMLSAMAYDEESDRVILFGGREDGPDKIANTWAYDYNTDSWQELSPSTQPPWLRAHDMTYDNESDTIVLYGGSNIDDLAQGDTWLFDYNTVTWTKASPYESPSPRLRENLVYDYESDITISFGGADAGFYIGQIITTDLTWVYDVNADNWTKMSARPEEISTFSISLVSHSPHVPLPDDSVLVLAYAEGAVSAKVQYRIGTADWTDVTMTVSDAIWTGLIPEQPEGTTITYRVVAMDAESNQAMSSLRSYTVHGKALVPASFPIELIAFGAIASVIVVLVALILKERR